MSRRSSGTPPHGSGRGFGDGASDELLSREELEALGGGATDEATPSDSTEGKAALVLVVARNRDEASFLRAELELLGHRPLLVSNPYRALDALRSGRVDWFLSALEPWGPQARLLVERHAEVPPRRGTLLIDDGATFGDSVARLVGAKARLQRPIASSDLALHLRFGDPGREKQHLRDGVATRWPGVFEELRRELSACESSGSRVRAAVEAVRRSLDPLFIIHWPRSADCPGFHFYASATRQELALERFRRRIREWPRVDEALRAARSSRRAVSVALGAAGREGWLYLEFSEPPSQQDRVFVQELGDLLGREL